jgi:hypothetical protein
LWKHSTIPLVCELSWRKCRANSADRGAPRPSGGGEGLRPDDPILLVDKGCDVQIPVRIDASDDATLYFLDNCHSQPPALATRERLRRDRMRGQDSHEIKWSSPSRVTGIREANPHRTQGVPGGRQVRDRHRVDRSAGQAAPGALRRQFNQWVHRCESQATWKLAFFL